MSEEFKTISRITVGEKTYELKSNVAPKVVTWSELKELKDSELLSPGLKYRITDYSATINSSNSNARSANMGFNVTVEALTINRLSEIAQASNNGNFSNSTNLGAWKIRYCLDNDTTRFKWADDVNGKGVIYWMEDEWGNSAHYDFKGIKFNGKYTFGDSSNDNSLNGNCSGNKIGINKDESGYLTTINLGSGSKNNIIGNNCSGINLGSGSINTTIGNNCKNLGFKCINSRIGNNVSNIIFENNNYGIENVTICDNNSNITITPKNIEESIKNIKILEGTTESESCNIIDLETTPDYLTIIEKRKEDEGGYRIYVDHYREEELLKRIQGTSENTDATRDPFKWLGEFEDTEDETAIDKFNEFLNNLSNNTDKQYLGNLRVLVRGTLINIINYFTPNGNLIQNVFGSISLSNDNKSLVFKTSSDPFRYFWRIYRSSWSSWGIINNNEIKELLKEKQDKLEDGVNIKTINGEGILGEGNIEIQGGVTLTEEDITNMGFTKNAYIKPTNGIPTSDLVEEVQSTISTANILYNTMPNTGIGIYKGLINYTPLENHYINNLPFFENTEDKYVYTDAIFGDFTISVNSGYFIHSFNVYNSLGHFLGGDTVDHLKEISFNSYTIDEDFGTKYNKYRISIGKESGTITDEDLSNIILSFKRREDNWGQEEQHIDLYDCIGNYTIKGNHSNTNDGLPITNTGEISANLKVIRTDGSIMQVLTLLNSSGEGNIFLRTYKGTWSDWKSIGSGEGITEIPVATADTIGGIKLGSNAIDEISYYYSPLITDSSGCAYAKIYYASDTDYGIVKVNKELGNIDIDNSGYLKIGTARVNKVGGIKYSDNLDINNYVGLSGQDNGTSGINLGTGLISINNVLNFNISTSTLPEYVNLTMSNALNTLGINLGSGLINMSGTLGLKHEIKDFTWDANSNMNSFKEPGVYEIYGERTRQDDNLPILNASSGHSIAAILNVVDSSLRKPDGTIPSEKCITQFLQLSNRLGNEGKSYIRTYNENNGTKDGWSAWKTVQSIVEDYLGNRVCSDTKHYIFANNSLSEITDDDNSKGLNGFIDNGNYAGVYCQNLEDIITNAISSGLTSPDQILGYIVQNASFETYNLVVINDYSLAGLLGKERHVTQIKTSIITSNGRAIVKKRVGTGNSSLVWTDWEDTCDAIYDLGVFPRLGDFELAALKLWDNPRVLTITGLIKNDYQGDTYRATINQKFILSRTTEDPEDLSITETHQFLYYLGGNTVRRIVDGKVQGGWAPNYLNYIRDITSFTSKNAIEICQVTSNYCSNYDKRGSYSKTNNNIDTLVTLNVATTTSPGLMSADNYSDLSEASNFLSKLKTEFGTNDLDAIVSKLASLK